MNDNYPLLHEYGVVIQTIIGGENGCKTKIGKSIYNSKKETLNLFFNHGLSNQPTFFLIVFLIITEVMQSLLLRIS